MTYQSIKNKEYEIFDILDEEMPKFIEAMHDRYEYYCDSYCPFNNISIDSDFHERYTEFKYNFEQEFYYKTSDINEKIKSLDCKSLAQVKKIERYYDLLKEAVISTYEKYCLDSIEFAPYIERPNLFKIALIKMDKLQA